jgi:hypothetical protein
MTNWIEELEVGDKLFHLFENILSPAKVIKITPKQIVISYQGRWSSWASTGYFRKSDGKSVFGGKDSKTHIVEFTQLNEILYDEMVEYRELSNWFYDQELSVEDLRHFKRYLASKENL